VGSVSSRLLWLIPDLRQGLSKYEGSTTSESKGLCQLTQERILLIGELWRGNSRANFPSINYILTSYGQSSPRIYGF
jgi:hypothetical protein